MPGTPASLFICLLLAFLYLYEPYHTFQAICTVLFAERMGCLSDSPPEQTCNSSTQWEMSSSLPRSDVWLSYVAVLAHTNVQAVWKVLQWYPWDWWNYLDRGKGL